jgi:ubiquinone/menaquinone biosynthesis C-methylase UbiE
MSDSPKTASDYFGAMGFKYDSLIHRSVPRYDAIIDTLINYLPPHPQTVLELGCGSGALSLSLVKYASECDFTFVDASEEMIEATRARVQEDFPETARRATFVIARFEEYNMGRNQFDVVTSSISLHHVEDKGALFRRVREAIKSGGTFRFVDQLSGGTEANHARMWQSLLEFMGSPGNCTEVELQSMLAHSKAHDHYTPLAAHFHLLQEAGFVGIDCVWRDEMWTVITADVT